MRANGRRGYSLLTTVQTVEAESVLQLGDRSNRCRRESGSSYCCLGSGLRNTGHGSRPGGGGEPLRRRQHRVPVREVRHRRPATDFSLGETFPLIFIPFLRYSASHFVDLETLTSSNAYSVTPSPSLSQPHPLSFSPTLVRLPSIALSDFPFLPPFPDPVLASVILFPSAFHK